MTELIMVHGTWSNRKICVYGTVYMGGLTDTICLAGCGVVWEITP